jgi:hypothetical protein
MDVNVNASNDKNDKQGLGEQTKNHEHGQQANGAVDNGSMMFLFAANGLHIQIDAPFSTPLTTRQKYMANVHTLTSR